MKDIRDVSQIHVVPYSHHDHAWTNTREWHIWRYIEGFCMVLDRMKEDPGYTLEIDNIVHSLEVFERYCPSRKEEFSARVREGRISVANGGAALVRPADFDGELLIRNGCAGRRAFMSRYGLEDIPVYWNADTACGTSQMPQLLRLMGHRYYRFQRPEATLNLLGVPIQFVWRGLDGSEIIVARGVYGGCMFNRWAEPENDTWQKRRDAFIREELSDKLCCETSDQLLLNVGQDDCLPMLDLRDRYYPLEDLMSEWNRSETSQMQFSTLDRFFSSLPREELPVWEGAIDECELSFNAALRVDASLRKMRSACERGLLTCERLNAIAVSLGESSREETLNRLWERLFRFSGHAMQHLLDSDYDDVRDSASATVTLIDEQKRHLMDAIACRTARLSKVSKVLVNPTVNGGVYTVELNFTTPHHIDGLKLTDAGGRELEYQICDVLMGDKPYSCQFTEVRAVVAVPVPAMGWTTIRVECDGRRLMAPEHKPLTDNFVVDNGVFNATFRNGMIENVVSASGCVVDHRQLVVPRFSSTMSTGDWTHNWKPVQTFDFEPAGATLLENGPIRWKIVTKGTIGTSPAEITTIIERGSPTIQFAMELDNREGEGFYSLNLPCSGDPGIRAGIPFGEETRHPELQKYSEEDNQSLLTTWERGWPYAFYANGYASFRSGSGRLLLLQGDCTNLMRAEPGSGEMTQLLYRSVDLSLKTVRWMQHMNRDMEGRGLQHFQFAVSVMPERHDSALCHALLQKQRYPVCAATRHSLESGSGKAEASWLKLTCDHVQLSAAYLEGDQAYIRLYETRGEAGEVHMTLPKGYADPVSVDFNGGEMDRPLRILSDCVAFDMRPYEIRTLLLTRRA